VHRFIHRMSVESSKCILQSRLVGAAALMNYNAMPVHVSCVRKQLWRITYAWKRNDKFAKEQKTISVNGFLFHDKRSNSSSSIKLCTLNRRWRRK